MSNSSISLTDRSLSGATTPDESGPATDSNEGVKRILQISSITGASPSHYWQEVFLLCRDAFEVFNSHAEKGYVLAHKLGVFPVISDRTILFIFESILTSSGLL